MLGIVAFKEFAYGLPDIGIGEKVTANIRLFAIEVDKPEDVNVKVRVKAEPVPMVGKDGGPFTEKVNPKT